MEHPRAVVLAWLCCFLGCALFTTFESGNISNGGFSVPGSETARAEALARRNIPSFAGTLVIAVLTSAQTGVSAPEQKSDIEATINPVKSMRDMRAVEAVSSSVYRDHQTGQPATVLVYFLHMALPFAAAESHIPEIEARLAHSAPWDVSFGLLGEAASSYRDAMAVRDDLTRAELIALPITFCMLVVAFLSLTAALLPLLLATVVLTFTLALVHLISLVSGLSVFVLDTASAVALGLSIDYSLIVVTRFREERARGLSADHAVERSMQTAGRAVVLSGLSIAALLPALMVVGVGLFTSIALGGIIASLGAVAAATTLLPAILALLATHLDRLSFKPAVEAARRGTFWRRLATVVTTHPTIVTVVSLASLLALATPALSLQLDFHSSALSPSHSVATHAEESLERTSGPGATGLVEVVTRAPGRVRAIAIADPGVRSIWRVRHGASHWSELDLLLTTGPNSNGAQETVARLRRDFDRRAPSLALVGGLTAGEMDLSARIARRLPTVLIVAFVIALVVLMLGIRSLLIPIKAVACSALSVMATLGVLQLLYAPSRAGGGIAFFVPIVTFVLVLGLSIDYEVFLLTRTRELLYAGRATADAVAGSLARTGRPITLAGLVVTTVFAALILSSLRAVQQLGVAVTVGVLLDISVVRWLLSPACVVLAGRWNWWLPSLPILGSRGDQADQVS